jgi:hypothetical protein
LLALAKAQRLRGDVKLVLRGDVIQMRGAGARDVAAYDGRTVRCSRRSPPRGDPRLQERKGLIAC